jgi:cell wall-associated NlpC family hydrolase
LTSSAPRRATPTATARPAPNAFDCSGLIYYSYRKAGFTNIPRTSSQQARAFRPVKRSNMRKGDLVFFHSRGDVYHAGVYSGRRDGRRMIIHASRSGTPVKRDPIWTNSWFARTLR